MSFVSLLNSVDQVTSARLLAAATKESGMWLHAVPVPSLGTQLDPESLWVAVALQVGASVCEWYKCRCGSMMDTLGHRLSCRFNAGRCFRHSALKDVVKRALYGAGIPFVLEPLGIDLGENTCPDGLTIVPSKNGKSQTCDCTCVDTFAKSHVYNAAQRLEQLPPMRKF